MEKKRTGKINIFWFRRDLRLHDNAGLFHALKSGFPLLPVFIFDTGILGKLEDRNDARVMFIHDEIGRIHASLENNRSGVFVRQGDPLEIFRHLAENYHISAVFCNHDYEPYALQRDGEIKKYLDSKGILFHTFKDQVIFEKAEILNGQGEPYKVFTPYRNAWLSAYRNRESTSFPSEKLLSNMISPGPEKIPSLHDLGFMRSSLPVPSREFDTGIISSYDKNRDFPASEGTSRLGIHLRHGTLSIREAARIGEKYNPAWLNELIWREFYMMILFHFPRVINHAFKSGYDRIPWDNDEENYSRWCEGRTGYPMVDAGMRELDRTGYMHNRVRMITASFLAKHLLIDWRWGEAWFGRKLLDYELASNNGGWQWAAGTGTDAQPYFRIFNPYVQVQKFDPELRYIKKWIPEINTDKYPKPMIDHTFARIRAIETYKKAIG
ncbi:MAG: deoxyribodipyrimidine photo-lyase [Cyclobacteriaceae bacterium]|nr:deoxyribodipyrimidine photo-lyase [Cyclobacteriaceae bacterium]